MSKVKVQLHTFKNWGVDSEVGYTTVTDSGRELVDVVWCKVCARHFDKVTKSQKLRGKSLKDYEKFVVGTGFITKHTVNRHLNCQAHAAAREFERLREENSTDETTTSATESSTSASSSQPRINTALNSFTRSAYKKLVNTAYILATEGMALKSFKTLVNVQKSNGVQLVDGVDNGAKAREFVHELALASQQKLCQIIDSSKFFTVLSDGSQARKTGSEKELILIRTVRNGIPENFLMALQNVDEFGDATAEILKTVIDDVFKNIEQEQYTKKLVAATADGASVNMGCYNGLLTKMKQDDRHWLLIIHCVCHRVELAVKDILHKEKYFKDIEDLMITLYYLFKRSGKFKRHFEKTAKALEAHVYKFPKTSGTRFVDHHKRGLNVLLNNWVTLLVAIENSVANKKYSNINAKLLGIRKKLTDFNFIAVCCLYSTVLERVSKLSLFLQSAKLNIYEAGDYINKLIADLKDFSEEIPKSNEDIAKSHKFTVKKNLDRYEIIQEVIRAGFNKFTEKQYVQISHVGVHNVDRASEASKKLLETISSLSECFSVRFNSFQEGIYKSMKWIDPAMWSDETPDAEIELIINLAEHFKVPLEYHKFNFDLSILRREWKDVKWTVRTFFSGSGFQKPESVWKNLILYKSKQFPNVCLLAELVMSIGVTNSIVESGFSFLNSMLTDSRLSLKHSTMADLLMLKVNHLVWNQKDIEQIQSSALDSYLSTKRKAKLHKPELPEVNSILGKRPHTPDSDTEDSKTSGESESDVTDCVSVQDSIDSDSDSDSENLTATVK